MQYSDGVVELGVVVEVLVLMDVDLTVEAVLKGTIRTLGLAGVVSCWVLGVTTGEDNNSGEVEWKACDFV